MGERNIHHQWYDQREKRDVDRQKRNLDLAHLIAHFRQQRGLSQEQLARASRLSRTYIYHLEQAQRTHPSGEVVQRIARALELPVAEQQQLFQAYTKLTGQIIQEDRAEQTVPDLRELIDEFACNTVYPMHTLDRWWFVPTWNEAALSLFEMPREMITEKPLHLLEWLFTSHIQQSIVSWEQVAARLVDDFCYHTRSLAHLPAYKKLWKQFRALPRFSRIASVNAAGGKPAPSLQVQVYHSRLGILTLKTVTMQVKGSYNDWMVCYLPGDQRTLQHYRLSFGYAH